MTEHFYRPGERALKALEQVHQMAHGFSTLDLCPLSLLLCVAWSACLGLLSGALERPCTLHSVPHRAGNF